MITIGKHHVLHALRDTQFGFFLGDSAGNEVLLPKKYVPEDLEEGEPIMVFVYLDSENRPVATTLQPKVLPGEFAALQARQVNEVGAFMDWGLEKDLFVPFKEQQDRMEPGKWYIVRPYLDAVTGRLVGTTRRNRFLDFNKVPLVPGEEVNLLICESTDLGVKVVINNRYGGMLYHNQIFQKIEIGQRIKGYVKEVREGNKVDVTLQKQGFEHLDEFATQILKALEKNKGFLPLTDKSDPEEVKARLQMSKKTFKKALGGLYKKRLVRLEEDGVYLV
ncbi:MAG: GntR family transcriptional regulator [Bacteroidia bacterium]|nr:GntR family transcriptional regulator [Bacteroidia bacterium]